MQDSLGNPVAINKTPILLKSSQSTEYARDDESETQSLKDNAT